MIRPHAYWPSITVRSFLAKSRDYFATHDGMAPRPIKNRSLIQQSTITTSNTNLPRKTMNSSRNIARSFLLAAGLGAFLAGPVLAGPACDPMGHHHGRHEKMLEQHHKLLHEALKLTPAQEPAWTKLMETERPNPAAGMGASEDWAKLKAPERAEKMLELGKARQERMAEHVAALKVFYAALTAEQQKVFDEFHSSPRAMRGKPGRNAPAADKPAAKF